MFGWLTGSDETKEVVNHATIKGLDPGTLLTIPDFFVDEMFARGIKTSHPCSQSILFEGRGDNAVFILRVCPVWDMSAKVVTEYILEAKQMYHPHSRDFQVFIDWIMTHGISADRSDDKRSVQLRTCPPMRVKGSDEKFQNQELMCTINPVIWLIEKVNLRVWLLKYTASVETTELPPLVTTPTVLDHVQRIEKEVESTKEPKKKPPPPPLPKRKPLKHKQ
jgi:hypothetical protein